MLERSGEYVLKKKIVVIDPPISHNKICMVRHSYHQKNISKERTHLSKLNHLQSKYMEMKHTISSTHHQNNISLSQPVFKSSQAHQVLTSKTKKKIQTQLDNRAATRCSKVSLLTKLNTNIQGEKLKELRA